MTTAAGSERDRALQRLADAQRAEDASWSLVLRTRASYEGALTAEDRQATFDSYLAFTKALHGLAPKVGELVQAAGELGVWSGLGSTGAE